MQLLHRVSIFYIGIDSIILDMFWYYSINEFDPFEYRTLLYLDPLCAWFTCKQPTSVFQTGVKRTPGDFLEQLFEEKKIYSWFSIRSCLGLFSQMKTKNTGGSISLGFFQSNCLAKTMV